MIESGYYPPGSEFDPNAPYNQSEPEPVEVDVTISQSLSRSTKIKVTDYISNEWEDVEPNNKGGFYRTKEIEYDFSDCDLKGAYEEQEYTIPELLDYLIGYLVADIAKCNEESNKKKKLQHILKCCEGWILDETEVIEE